MSLFSHWTIERDDQGMPCKMLFNGFEELPEPKTREQLDAEKLAEHERIYGKRVEWHPAKASA